jgi:hypothetical protein
LREEDGHFVQIWLHEQNMTPLSVHRQVRVDEFIKASAKLGSYRRTVTLTSTTACLVY